jgi:hypothetical protein
MCFSTCKHADFAMSISRRSRSTFLLLPGTRLAGSADHAPHCEMNEWQKLGSALDGLNGRNWVIVLKKAGLQ